MKVIRLLLLSIGVFAASDLIAQDFEFDASDYNRRLGQAVNLGNALEAPNEGDWGLRLQSWHFDTIAEGGFDSVRVPIRWSAHAATEAPYTIDEDFFERIDWVIEQSQQNDLAVILNVHHYEELVQDVSGHQDRLAGLWSQIAERYQSEPTTSVYFEILNEPNTNLTESLWPGVMQLSLDAIRETNADRQVIVGGANWNSWRGLQALSLPSDDQNLIGTFHYYDPFEFTHQGAEWVNGSNEWLGTEWTGTNRDVLSIRRAFQLVEEWGIENDRPVFLGEFGAYRFGDLESRSAWTETIVEEASSAGLPWSYWEFAAGFGVFDPSTREWNEEIYDALSPISLKNLDDADGLTSADLDALQLAIVSNSTDERFDLDGNGEVELRDQAFWLHFSENTVGDANLDGAVGFSDFLVVSANFGKASTWSGGDFTADGVVAFDDFLALSRNFESATIASVPEPRSGPAAILLFALWLLSARRMRASSDQSHSIS